MATVGWYGTSSDGSSASGGVSKGIHGNMTFTASSALTIEGSGKFEILFDTAGVTSKTEALKIIEKIEAAITNDTWPPSGKV